MMQQPSALPGAAIGAQKPAPTETRLHGRWLFAARLFWGIIALFELVAFVDSLSGTVSQLQVLCTSSCTNLQLSAAGVSTLQRIGLSQGDYIAFYLVVTLISSLLCYAVAALLVWRRSDDWMALLVSLMLVGFSAGILSNGVRFSQWFGLAWAGHLSSLFDGITLTILVQVFFLFPDSRYVPRWTRWIAGLQIVLGIFLVFFPRFTSDLVNNISLVLFFGILLSLVIAQVYRYRRVSTPVQRQQTKWIVYSLAVAIILVLSSLTVLNTAFPTLAQPGGLLASAPDIIANAFLTLIPLSFGVAILRYRLWDIDTIINKTLVYGLLTGLLVIIYSGLIIGMESLVGLLTGQASQPVVIVISTLVIYVLFQPLRQRIQRMIDRRFYRKKYDAEKTLAAFSATLRNEVDLDQLSEQLLAVVRETMQPAHVSLWLRPVKLRSEAPGQVLIRAGKDDVSAQFERL